MDRPVHPSKITRCGVCEIDLKASELRKHGLRLKLSEQPFQILAILLENPGEIVTRDELRERLWPGDTFVDFDHGLNNAVMRLREVLGDSSDRPRFIETLPRRGYRFIAPTEEIHSAGPVSAATSHPTEPRDDSSAGAIVSPVAVGTASASGEQLAAHGNAKRRLTLPRVSLMSAAVLAFWVPSRDAL